MKFRFYSIYIIIFVVTTLKGQAQDIDKQLDLFFNKKDVTILVTDSGLGGLSVVADLSERLSLSGIFNEVRIIFFNALFHKDSGYNNLSSIDEKVRIFNIVLEAMAEKYRPDLLLIACNTLSVIYDQTPFSKKENFPVIGIVDAGVDLIVEELEKTPHAAVIIFATETTINSNSYKNQLTSRGYLKNQIIGQACPLLSESIERDYKSELTYAIIEEYKTQALEKLHTPATPVIASLNCSHYGYSVEIFRQVFAEAGYADIKIFDPNPRMTEFIFKSEYMNRFPKTRLQVKVVSRTKISDEKIKSLSVLLNMTSHKTAEAFTDYLYNPNLFDPKFEIEH